ncbi:hypothetical protein STEG23_014225, partial [Scotinomys teguina]
MKRRCIVTESTMLFTILSSQHSLVMGSGVRFASEQQHNPYRTPGDCRQLLNFLSFFSIHLLVLLMLREHPLRQNDDMAAFGPYLGQMRKLHILVLEGNTFRMDESEGLEEERISTLQFPKFHCLKHLYVNDIYLLVGCMREWFGSLKKLLETLSITYCHLFQSDLDHLPQCLNLSELKYLYLSSVLLAELTSPGKSQIDLAKPGTGEMLAGRFRIQGAHVCPKPMLPAHQ